MFFVSHISFKFGIVNLHLSRALIYSQTLLILTHFQILQLSYSFLGLNSLVPLQQKLICEIVNFRSDGQLQPISSPFHCRDDKIYRELN